MATANNAPPPVINTGISWNPNPMGRSFSVSSHSDSEHGGAASTRSRNSSTASAFSLFKRAFAPPAAKGRASSLSVPVPEANPRGFRASMSAACPAKMSTFGDHPHTILTTIPPTPGVMNTPRQERGGLLSPFKDTGDYFAFGEESSEGKRVGSAGDDLMQM